MDNVTLSVRSELSKIVEDLAKVQQKAEQVSRTLGDMGKDSAEDLNKKAKQTENYFTKMRDVGRRTVDQLKRDFKSLLAVNALSESMKLSSQFAGSVKETIQLSDAVRKLGSTFGLTASQFSAFQSMLSKGLGGVGLSSETAANALRGLSETPVRGQRNLTEYAKAAGMLASISGEKGNEAAIAKGLAGVVTARGGNPNDLAQMQSVSNDVLRIRQATGKSATESMQALSSLFSGANPEFQKLLQSGGGVSLATAGLLGGQGATSFLERYLGMNKFERSGMEAQGLGRLIGAGGQLNAGAFSSTISEASRRGQGDVAAGLRTFGFSDEEAKGFIRLAQAVKENGAVIEQARTKVVDINKSYREGMGLGEAFRANINKVKSYIDTSSLTQGATDILGKASETGLGAGAVVAGGGVLAALLAGYGLRGIGKGLGGMAAGGLAAGGVEALTGRQVQPVYVVNASEIGGLGGAASALASGAGGLVGKFGKFGRFGALGLAAGTGIAGGAYLGSQLEKTELGKKFYDGLADLLLSIPGAFSRGGGGPASKEVKVKVELNKRELKESRQPTRGASYGP